MDPAPAADIPGSVVRDGRFRHVTWMLNVGASWLRTTLSPSLLIIALVQAA